jgi:hypothetical protein
LIKAYPVPGPNLQLISVSLTVKVTRTSVAVGIIVGVEVGLWVGVEAGVTVGFGAMKTQAAKSIKISPIKRTRRFIISSFGICGGLFQPPCSSIYCNIKSCQLLRSIGSFKSR